MDVFIQKERHYVYHYHLLKFKNDINFTGPISDYTGYNKIYKKEFYYSKITIGGKWFSNDLEKNFNITSNKSFTTTFPDIPNNFIPAFIRGYFDGDGSITYNSVNKLDIINIVGIGNIINTKTYYR